MARLKTTAMTPADELQNFLRGHGPSTMHPNNPMGEGVTPSANLSNPAMNQHLPGAFNNPSNPQMNPDLPGSLTNPSNLEFNPQVPNSITNPSSPQRNPAYPTAINNPSSPNLNPAYPGAYTNPSNPINNPAYPTPSDVPRPEGISPDASVPPGRIGSWVSGATSYPTRYYDFGGSKWGWAGRWPTIWHDNTLHIGPEGYAHAQLARQIHEQGYSPLPEGDPQDWREGAASGWIGKNPETHPPDEDPSTYWGSDAPPEQYEHNSQWYGWYGGYERIPSEVTEAMHRYDQYFLNPQLQPEEAQGFGHARRFADNWTSDSRQWPDPSEPRAGKPPKDRGCTCEEGHKLDCPIHGMWADPDQDDHLWNLPEGSPVGYPQDAPRSWQQAYSGYYDNNYQCPNCGTELTSAGHRGFTPIDAWGPSQYSWQCPKCGIDFGPIVSRPMPKEGGIPLDQIAYIAEGALERGGLIGHQWTVQQHPYRDENGNRIFDPAEEEMTAFARQVTGDNHIIVVATNWFDGVDTTSGSTDLYNRINVRYQTNELVILHECAHIMRGDHGHDLQWFQIAHDLYTHYLGAEAGQNFWNLVEPYIGQREARAAPEPPNYRKATKINERCGTCKMFDKGLCWGFGNTKVESSAVCDEFFPENKSAAILASVISEDRWT